MRLPNAQDFATVGGAAHMLGVSRTTVLRYITAGVLTVFWPCGAPTEKRYTLLATSEIRQLAAARRVLGKA